jgi:iron complex outermembrane receptor protein
MGGGYGFANNFTSRGLTVSFFRDAMPDGTSPMNGYYRTMYDVERIEVLKGPGSALFGAAGPGGSINMISKQPRSAFSASTGTMFGSFGTLNGYLDVTGPMGKSFAGRFITDLEHADGFRGLKRDIFDISPSMMWRLADDKTLTVDFDHREIKIKPDNYGTLFDFNSNLVVPRENRYYSPFNYTSNTINRVTLVHNWTISADLSMRTAFAYDGRRLDMLRNGGGNQANAAGIITGRDARHQTDHQGFATFQNEAIWKTATGPIKHTLLGGFEYKNVDITTVRGDFTLPNAVSIFNPFNLETSLNGIARRPTFDRKINSDQTSFYAQDQIELTEQLKLRLGIRNDLVQWSDKGFQSVSGNYRYREIVRTRSLTTYSTGGVYQPTQNLAFYAGYSTGAFINLSTEPTSVATAPETSNQIEVGAKTTFLDGKADLNVALFQSSRNNYFINVDPTASSLLIQAGKDRSRGVEVSLAFRPIAGLSIIGNGVWMDPETLSSALARNNVLLPGQPRSIAGNRPVGVATNMGSLWTTYQVQSGLARGVMLGFGVTYKGDSFADALNLLRVPSYVVYDAMASYRVKNLEVAVNVRNLTDKTYYTNPTFAGALPGDPLSAYGSVRLYFN